MAQQPSLLDLPDELLQSICALLPLHSLAAFQSSCRRLAAVGAHSLLWRDHCIQSYRYWNSKHNLDALRLKPASETDWKGLLAKRKLQDRHVLRTLNRMLDSRVNRLHMMQEIVDHGYDAKDILLKESNVPEDAEDVLARMYWCNEALGYVERSVAIEEWRKLAHDEHYSLERSLGVYDLFTTERPPETLQQITQHLDALAAAFSNDNPELGPPRETALRLVSWLRARNLTGLTEAQYYYNLQNNLISIALCDAEHPSLPLISAVIFCCIARRISLNAHPCGYHSHVLAIVEPNPGFTLDGHPKPSSASSTTTSTDPERMYLDPFDSVTELPLSSLRAQLSAYGISNPSDQTLFLSPSSTKDMVLRVARNITHSVRWATRSPHEGDYPPVLPAASASAISLLSLPSPTALRTRINRHRARYAANWATVLLTTPLHSTGEPRQRALLESLNEFVPTLEPRFSSDLPLVHSHIVPLVPPGDLRDSLLHILSRISSEDTRPCAPQPRTGVAATKVRHSIGTVFRHLRFGYTAVVVGWDTRCKLGDEWIAQMRVDTLPGGREQCFYHAVVAEDESTRYVAEENIEVLEGLEGMPGGFGAVAGRWFRRWEGGRFVSNVKEDFPDD